MSHVILVNVSLLLNLSGQFKFYYF